MLFVMFSSAGCRVEEHKARVEKLKFNALVFENNSEVVLENITVSVQNTGAFMSCSVILIDRSCSTTFREKVYIGNMVDIAWEVDGVAYKAAPFYVMLPGVINGEEVASVLIVFSPGGTVTASFKY